jgi:hypothetical protein
MTVGAWVPLLACPAVPPENTASKLAVAPKYETEFRNQSTKSNVCPHLAAVIPQMADVKIIFAPSFNVTSFVGSESTFASSSPSWPRYQAGNKAHPK